MHTKMFIHYSLLRRMASYKVCLCFIVLWVTVCTVGYVCLFHGEQIFVDFVSFLSMIIYEVLYTWCLRYNICSAWFLDIRVSTCFMLVFVIITSSVIYSVGDCSNQVWLAKPSFTLMWQTWEVSSDTVYAEIFAVWNFRGTGSKQDFRNYSFADHRFIVER